MSPCLGQSVNSTPPATKPFVSGGSPVWAGWAPVSPVIADGKRHHVQLRQSPLMDRRLLVFHLLAAPKPCRLRHDGLFFLSSVWTRVARRLSPVCTRH